MKYNKLKNIIDDYSQVNRSKLHTETAEVMGLKESEIESVIDGFCNVVSTYAGFKTEYNLDLDYKQYLNLLLDNNYIKRDGYFLVAPIDVAHLIGVKGWDEEFYEEWADVIDPDRLDEGGIYKLKIKGHFIICMKHEGVVIGFDTMNRGNPFIVADKIKPQQFVWLMKI